MPARSALLLALALAALLASPLAGAQSAVASQRWYPSNTAGPGTTFVAYRTAPGGDGGTATLDEGANRVWTANEAAAATVDMSGAWDVALVLAGSFTGTFKFEVGNWTGGTFTKAGESQQLNVGDECTASACAFTVSTGPGFFVAEGHYLAFRIHNIRDPRGEGSAVGIVMAVDGTYAESDEGAADYPVPELGTLLLAGAGLAAMGLALRRRRG